MKNIQNFTATTGLAFSFFLAICTTNLAMHTQFATNQPPKRDTNLPPLYTTFSINRAIYQMDEFRSKFDVPLLAQEVEMLFTECQEGCTLGLMRKLATNYQNHHDKPELLREANRETTKFLMNKRHLELHYDDNPNLPLWLWAEKKCNNEFLKKVVQLICIDTHNIVAKTLANLIKKD